MKLNLNSIKYPVSFLKTNLRGWKTDRKIIVFESDDWGSIRMPSKESYSNIIKAGIPIDKCPFLRNDSFETVEDFHYLFKVLKKFKDKNGKHPVITANYILRNPDFKKIKDSNYNNFSSELFTEHLIKTNKYDNYFNILRQGIRDGLIKPQLHGPFHVNVKYWMEYLNTNSASTIIAFNNLVYGLSTNVVNEERKSFLATFDYDCNSDFINFLEPALIKSIKDFENIFGYKSLSFIAPNYVWDKKIEEVLSKNNIKLIQSAKHRKRPSISKNSKRHEKIILGSKNEFGQTYLTRNILFEPSTSINKIEHMQECFNKIHYSFLLNKPAIISTHRLNFMGGLNLKNREENLMLLEELLTNIIRKWPQVEFFSSDDLGNIINN
tara:strand:- start:3596 stop:4735 length:1140 start_codon:yes stop_codon:yes gene_type:complete